jgi:hypothetical protein
MMFVLLSDLIVLSTRSTNQRAASYACQYEYRYVLSRLEGHIFLPYKCYGICIGPHFLF